MRLFAVFVGLAIGNFFAQSLSGDNYELALERTYFQGLALLTYWICTVIELRNKKS